MDDKLIEFKLTEAQAVLSNFDDPAAGSVAKLIGVECVRRVKGGMVFAGKIEAVVRAAEHFEDSAALCDAMEPHAPRCFRAAAKAARDAIAKHVDAAALLADAVIDLVEWLESAPGGLGMGPKDSVARARALVEWFRKSRGIV